MSAGPASLTLHGAVTPNVAKVTIMLEEAGLAYRLVHVDVVGGEQFAPEFLALNPNAKVPVLAVEEGDGQPPFAIAESGAILLYLSERTGVLHEPDDRRRAAVHQWLMFQMASLGPMLGQLRHFKMVAAPGNDHALARYGDEAVRLFGVMERRLQEADWFGGGYSIADVAILPWIHFIEIYRAQGVDFGLDWSRCPALRHWYARCLAREAVARGMDAVTAGLAASIASLKQSGRWCA